MTFSAFLQASAPGRSGRRRKLAVLLSASSHLAVLVAFVALRAPGEPPVRAAPEPIFLRLAPPPAAQAASTPRRPEVRRPRRPRPELVQPPVEPTPPEPPEEPLEPLEPLEQVTESDEEDAGAPEEARAAPGGRQGGMPGATGDAVLELRDVARAPAVLSQVRPEYPRQARWKGLEGLVVLRVVIGLDGRVEHDRTRVVASIPELDGAAVSAIEQWRFSPAIDHAGRVVRVLIEVPVRFTLR